MTAEVIDVAATGETLDGERTVALSRHRALTNPLTPQLAVTVGEFRSMIAQRDEIMRNLLTDGVHYGSPKDKNGKPVFDKPSLLLPGAERLASVFGLALEHDDEHPPEIDLDGEHHYRNGEPAPYIGYTRRVRVYKYDPNTGERICIGQYTGHANSWEDRYARDESPECPSCHERTVRRSKTEFYCWRKIGGCGETFRLDTEAIAGQTVGRHVHPNPSDIQNTLIQIADKRAAVKAIRSVTGFSDMFTQDGEDVGTVDPDAAEEPPPAAPPQTRKAAGQGKAWEFVPILIDGNPVTCPTCEDALQMAYGEKGKSFVAHKTLVKDGDKCPHKFHPADKTLWETLAPNPRVTPETPAAAPVAATVELNTLRDRVAAAIGLADPAHKTAAFKAGGYHGGTISPMDWLHTASTQAECEAMLAALDGPA